MGRRIDTKALLEAALLKDEFLFFSVSSSIGCALGTPCFTAFTHPQLTTTPSRERPRSDDLDDLDDLDEIRIKRDKDGCKEMSHLSLKPSSKRTASNAWSMLALAGSLWPKGIVSR